MATGTDRMIQIVPLNEKNFATWRIQIKMTLMRESLWGFVTGSVTVPTTEDARNKFNERKDRALATIVMAIQPSLLYLVGDPTDPKVVFDKLSSIFQKKTWSNKLRLRKTLYSMKLAANMSIHQLLKNFTEIFDELAIIGEAVEEEDRVIHLLAALPDSYGTLVTALEAQEKIPSWEVIQEKLLHEEVKLNAKDLCASTDNALASNVKSIRKNFKCFECGKIGHIKKNCRVFLKKLNESKYDTEVNSAEVDQSGYDSCGLISVLSACVSGSDSWILDSGASRHMSNSAKCFENLIHLKTSIEIKVGDGRIIHGTGIGNVKIIVKNSSDIILKNVLFVPKLAYNLISVSQLSKDGKSINFHGDTCEISSLSGDCLATGKKTGDLYELVDISIKCLSACNPDVKNIWHRRYCHLHGDGLNKLVREELADGIDAKNFNDISFCEPCAAGKNHRRPFPKKSPSRSDGPLELIHTDVCGKMSVPSLSGNYYFITFIDDFTRYVWVYVMQTKDQVYNIFKEWKTLIENQLDKKIKVLRSDNGGEYTSNQFKNYLKSEGVRHETTIPKTPEQNGVSERMNRSLVESVRTMLYDAGLNKKFWAEALATAVYVRNRCPTSALVGMTPYEAFHGSKPNVKHLRIFGCTAYAHVSKEERGKFDSKSNRCMLLGYGSHQKGYRLYDFTRSKVVFSRDVIFNENDISSQKEKENNATTIEPTYDEIYMEIPVFEPTDEESHEQDQQNRPERTKRAPNRYGDWTCVSEISDDPLTFQEAVNGEDSRLWKDAMQHEMDSMVENEVWELTQLPEKAKLIKCKWVYKKKLGADGNVTKYKARLVAKGFDQRYGIEYDQTFSPVAKFESIRTIMALSVQHGLQVHQMDVTCAFLNGELQEDVYMAQPEGYPSKTNEHLVCKLKRSIYGLKQAPRCWNNSLDNFLRKMNFSKSPSEPCVYVKVDHDDMFIVAVYVDDIILACRVASRINYVKSCLMEQYKMTDFGKLEYFLGVKISQFETGKMFLSQESYAQRLINKFGLSDANSVKTPIESNLRLTEVGDKSELCDPVLYQSVVGSLLYLSTKTRPDIAYAISKAARYCSKPTKEHWSVVKRIIRYIKGTLNYGLLYTKSESAVCVGYSDSDWAGEQSDRKSTSGFSFQLSGASISWNSSKQKCVALSTAEAEYMALSNATQEAVWLKQFFEDLNVSSGQPITIYEDNQATISISNDNICSRKTKHIDIKFHFVRDQISKNVICLKYCNTDNMIADILTKGLTHEKFIRCRKMLGVTSLN